MSVEPSESKETSSSASNWKLLSFLLAGVLIPIVAALLPWAIENWIPKHSLTFSYVGPIQGDGAVALELKVKNEGKEPQRNLEVWVPLRISSIPVPELTPAGEIEFREQKANVILESTIAPSSQKSDDKRQILYFDLLRPNEELNIKFFVVGNGVLLFDHELERTRVVSDGAMAELDMPSEELNFLFKSASVVLLALILFLLAFSIYYESFYPKEKKREDLRKQLEKLGG
jgi:hypothetical protein